MVFFGYLLLGLLAGLLAGAFGIGGGVLIVPALIIIFKQPMQLAVGTSLMVIIAISIAGAWRHWTLDNVILNIVAIMAIGGIIGAVLGASIIENVPPIYAKRALAIFLLFSAVRLWFTK